ncbi:hypothetical protein OPT61_g7639 [Boeremia exigua]|uniref:Uncharacterized protein n=1 Tax=Boeremia exigua TaxID=749465 RepID=A0ACC2I1R7_9PLEO|nr:hypothetical protein OPT61_g7639 [Boeremia exigua]
MVVVRKWGEDYINKSLRQIDSNSWLIGSLVLHRSPCSSDEATWNDDGDYSSYTLTEAPTPLPITTSPNSPYITLVHEAGDASAVWSIRDSAICKVRYIKEGITPESITLDFVQNQQPSFVTPKVIHHAFDNNQSYLFLRKLPGQTLDVAWPTLDIQNIIVEDEPTTGEIRIIDFKIAGYLPRGWIRTKFRLSTGMNLSASASNHPTWWRAEVQKALGAHRFEDYTDALMQWRG